jgi:DNA polymerase delta subunit 1
MPANVFSTLVRCITRQTLCAFALMIFELLKVEPTVVFHNGMMESAIVMYGRTKEGSAVTVRVDNYRPYLYMTMTGFSSHIHLRRHINEFLSEHFRVTRPNRKRHATEYVARITECRRQLVDGAALPLDMVRVRFYHSECIRPLSRAILNSESGFVPPVCDVQLNYEMRFMIDRDLTAHAWVEITEGIYEPLPDFSTTELVFSIDYHEVKRQPGSEQRLDSAPLRVLHFDIEVAGPPRRFVNAELGDPVIQIATLITEIGTKWYNAPSKEVPCPPPATPPLFYHLIQWRTLDAFDLTEYEMNGVPPQIEVVESEAELLRVWCQILRTYDVDIITGWNSTGFDLPYIMDRCTQLGVPCKIGRLVSERWGAVPTQRKRFNARGYKTIDVSISGRVTFDALRIVKMMPQKLAGYKLKDVAARYLRKVDPETGELCPESKEDLPYSLITPYWNGDDATRATLARYNLQDTRLIPMLIDALMLHVNSIELSRVQVASLDTIESRGVSVRTTLTIARVIRSRNAHGQAFAKAALPLRPRIPMDGYVGAEVFDPIRGFHTEKPIVVLDFESLYPTIMRAYNLGLLGIYVPGTTEALLEILGVSMDDVLLTSPNGLKTIDGNVFRSIINEVESDLMAARSVAKAAMRGETDPMRRAVQDGRQLALKIACNATYGYLGDENSPMCDPRVAAAITMHGKRLLNQAADLCKEHYPGLRVMYGDTDSVFLEFPGEPYTVAEGIRLGKEAAAMCTEHFRAPIRLQFEKCLYPTMLVEKKRYAGLYWTNPDAPDKMIHMGDEVKRRSSCRFLSRTMELMDQPLFYGRDLKGAMSVVRERVRGIWRAEIPISEFIATGEYTGKRTLATCVVNRRMKRDPSDKVHLGSRVQYVIVPGKESVTERADDPAHVERINGYVDREYYLKSLRGVLERYVGAVVSKQQMDELFCGDHTRNIVNRRPTTSIAHFFSAAK